MYLSCVSFPFEGDLLYLSCVSFPSAVHRQPLITGEGRREGWKYPSQQADPGQRRGFGARIHPAPAPVPPAPAPAPACPPSPLPAPPHAQVFYATIGASANVGLVVQTAPVLFLFSFIALAAHLGLTLGLGRLLGFSLRDLLLASNANIGGAGRGGAGLAGWGCLCAGPRGGGGPILQPLCAQPACKCRIPACDNCPEPLGWRCPPLPCIACRPLDRCGHGRRQGLDLLAGAIHPHLHAGLRHWHAAGHVAGDQHLAGHGVTRRRTRGRGEGREGEGWLGGGGRGRTREGGRYCMDWVTRHSGPGAARRAVALLCVGVG